MGWNEFKFGIGDVLIHKGNVGDENPPRLVVCELWLGKCHGGVQRFYGVRSLGHNDGWAMRADAVQFVHQSFKMIEDELAAYEPPTKG